MQITSESIYKSKRLKTKHGTEKIWTDDGVLISEGNMIDNKKDGHWKFYHRENGVLSNEGNYVFGKKTGLWKAYDKESRISGETSYENNLRDGPFILYDSLKTVVNKGVYQADTLYSVLHKVESKPNSNSVEQMPYIASCSSIDNTKERKQCSDRTLIEHVYKSMRYPADARVNDVQGRALVRFVVTKNGDIDDINVLVGLCQSIKEECLRVVQELPKWKPGMQDGKEVNVHFTLPIVFKLQ